MRRITIRLILVLIVLITLTGILNIQVTTRQGVNFKTHSMKIPLYLKLLDFFDRHYNYKLLSGRITDIRSDPQKRAMAIFSWTHDNVRRMPDSLPVVDDHVWNIIVRGYGTQEQGCDVFTTLCNYANLNAFWGWVYPEGPGKPLPFAFVNIRNQWFVFSPSDGVYFINKAKIFASIEEIKSGDWSIERLPGAQDEHINYSAYLKNLPAISKIELSRPMIQSPLKRLFFELKRRIRPNDNPKLNEK